MTKHDSAIETAVEWFVLKESGPFSDSDQRAFNIWLQQHPDNLKVWQKVCTSQAHFSGLPINAQESQHTLLQAKRINANRRQILKGALSFAGVSLLSWHYRHEFGITARLSSQSTKVGQQRVFDADNIGQLLLNTDSALDINQSSITLNYGEIAVTGRTRHTLSSKDCQLQAGENSHYVIRQQKQLFEFSPLNTSMLIQLKGQELLVAPDQTVQIQASNSPKIINTPPHIISWKSGLLSVTQIPLGLFALQLTRYIHGKLDVDPHIAHLRLSGSFSLAKPNIIIEQLIDTLPIKVIGYQGIWQRLLPA